MSEECNRTAGGRIADQGLPWEEETMGNSQMVAGLVIDEVLDRMGGDTDLLREITAIFLEEYPLLIDAIRAGIEAGDATQVERAAHSMKGSVSNFGAETATAAAYSVERLARQKRVGDTAAAFAQLQEEMVVLDSSLREMVRNL